MSTNVAPSLTYETIILINSTSGEICSLQQLIYFYHLEIQRSLLD